jgi:hypothetical protein
VNLIQVTTHYQGAPSRLFFLSPLELLRKEMPSNMRSKGKKGWGEERCVEGGRIKYYSGETLTPV